MHFRDRTDADHGLVVEMSGVLDSGSCSCLENYWARRLTGETRIHLVLRDAEADSAEGVATLVHLLEQSLRDGTSVTLVAAPQLVAHSLYKIGLLDHPRFRLDDPRSEEPYAG